MTSLTSNTASANTNAMLSMPTASAAKMKTATSQNFISYSMAPKTSTRKTLDKFFTVDWDLNMNELEFE